MKEILTAALLYQSKGFSVIPVGRNKKPLINWKEYQSRIASPAEIEEWYKKYPTMNIAIVTGKISGIVVVDIENGGNKDGYPPTVTAQSGGGGIHYYYKHPGYEVPNGARVRNLTDIRGDGGYVIAPPSVTDKGEYQWIISPDDSAFSEWSIWITKTATLENKEKKWLRAKDGVPEGYRNDAAASMAGKIISSTPPELLESIGWEHLKIWNNNKNTPPLLEKELRQVWDSIEKRDSNNNTRGKNQTELILEIIESKKDVILFHDDKKDAYISMPVGDHQEILPLKSKAIKRWLANEFYKASKKTISSENLKGVINLLEGRACFDGPEINLKDRISWFNKELWYDLTNEKWQAIKVSDLGWEIVNRPPVLFNRYQHSAPQTIPLSKGGDIKTIFNYINITNQEHKLLLLVYLISCFIPDFPHPLLVIFGPHGSAKSTISILLRQTVDPSKTQVVSMPRKQEDLIQALAHHAFLFFDNVSYISESTSDILCKAITGSGFTKRELYTNDDDIIYYLKRCIGINGINLVSTRPDLLDRSLLIEVERIDESLRKTEDDVINNFKNDLPVILGGIFDALSKTIKIKPSIKLSKLPRMADFALWGSAIAESIGHTKEEFLNAYQNNINQQTETILNESIVALTLISFMEERSWQKWEGTASELLKNLTEHASSLNPNTVNKYWPKAPNALSRALNVLKVTLQNMGLFITTSGGQKRKIIIEKINRSADTITGSTPNGNDTDDTDGENIAF